METNDKLLEIIKQLNDNRNKLSALFSLYNSSLLIAEDSRANLTNYFEQLIDHKNDLSTITRDISSASKAERAGVYTKNKSKINRLNTEVQQVNADFANSCKKYRVALQDCGSLKTEYKHEVSQLCKDFKANVDEETPAIAGVSSSTLALKSLQSWLTSCLYSVLRLPQSCNATRYFLQLFAKSALTC